MHLTKLFVVGLLIIHVLFPAFKQIPWFIASAVSIGLLFYVTGLTFGRVLYRNIPIISFAVFFSLFILFSAWLRNTPPNYVLLFMTAAKIIFIFNIMLAAVAWLGRNGLLFILKHIPSRRLKLFLMLLCRSIGGLRRNSAGIANQLRSRLDLSGRERFLIPRFYVRNLIMKDLYSFHHNQAALVSRLGLGAEGRLAFWLVSSRKIKDVIIAILSVTIIFADVLFQRI